MPVFPPHGTPLALADPESWRRFDLLRQRAEQDAEGEGLAVIRSVLAPVEVELWEEADAVAAEPGRQEAFVDSVWTRVDDALRRLGV
jgi:hypothetical protein